MDIIKNELKEVETKLEEFIDSSTPGNFKIKYRGKLFRANLFLLLLRIYNVKINKKHIDIATSLEIINIASLIHDEILEDSVVKIDMSYKWDNKIAILFADYILSRVIVFFLKETEDSVYREIFSALLTKCEGGFLKIKANSSLKTTENDYLKSVEMGSASLISASCSIVAKILNKKNTDFLASYGKYIGMAFQIMEDAMNVRNIIIVNNNIIRDKMEFKITLPFIYSFNIASVEDREKLIDIFDNYSLEKEKSHMDFLIDKYKGMDYTVNKVSFYIDRAIKEVNYINCSEASEDLKYLSKEIAKRDWWS